MRISDWSSNVCSSELSSYATGASVRNYDLDFLKHFSMVIGFLAVVTLALLVLSNHINGVIPPEVSPTAARATQARIAPVGGVYAGATGAAAQAAAKAADRKSTRLNSSH